MTHDDQFAEIASSLPDLAAIDDGATVTISRGDLSVSITRVDYESWVKHLTEHIFTRPARWIDGIEPFVSEQWIVHHAVVQESYRCLADTAFDCDNLALVPELMQTMHSMILYCRSLPQQQQ